MPSTIQQRMIFTNGWNTYLIPGDPEQDDDRFFVMRSGSRVGGALPQLLSEGWTVVSVTPLVRSANSVNQDDHGCTLIVLQKTVTVPFND
jgi:hypothetical protein